MAYSKLKAPLDGTLSTQTIEPKVYPIDWTENPICSGKRQANSNGDASARDAHISSEVEAAVCKLSIADESPSDAAAEAAVAAAETATQAAPPAPQSSDFDALLRGAPYDYVVLTDCVFSAKLAVPLVNTILCACGPRTTVLCCHEIRDEVRMTLVHAYEAGCVSGRVDVLLMLLWSQHTSCKPILIHLRCPNNH